MRIFLIPLILTIAIFAGCSQSNSPVEPVNPESKIIALTIPLGVSDFDSNGSPMAGMGTLGLFNLHINPQDVTVELTAMRTGALTDVLEVVDITNFMALAPCNDCAKISSVSLDLDGNLVVSIGLKHPFGAGDLLKPITGRNRADLHVFNVEGIIISNSAGTSFSGVSQTATDLFLKNADGYTAYLDDAIDGFYPTDATVHPYITHFDDYSAGNFDASNSTGFASVTDPPPSGNLVMAMGCDYDYQDYVFIITDPVDFIFAVGCTYAVSAGSKTERFTPEYRVPQHNKKAASEISVEFTTNELMGGITTSSADLEIRVVDISHQVAVGESLDEMFADSSVGGITIDIPGVLSTPALIDGSASSSGTGHDPSDPLVYSITIENEACADMGSYLGLVKVTDTYSPGLNTNVLLSGNDGIERVSPVSNPLEGLFAISEFAAYQLFDVDVAVGCGPITGSIDVPAACPTDLNNGATVNFEVSATSANGGGNIVLYEVDFDYDGMDFTADDSNTDGIFNGVGPFVVPDPCPPKIPYDFIVAFRGTDECVPPNETVFASCTVTVNSCEPAVGNVWITVNRVPSLNTICDPGDMFDPDGAWTLHWDAVSGAQEYAVYFDNDPGDYSLPTWSESELTDNLGATPLGTTTSTSYTVPAAHLPLNHYVIGNTYIVRARTVVGDPLSETGDSEPAYIMANGWETCPPDTPIMDPSIMEGWQAGWETSVSPGTWYRFPTTDNFYQNLVHGAINARVSSCNIGDMSWVGRYTSLVKRTPTVPNAPVRFLDFALQPWSSNYTTPAAGGVILGTCSTQPGHPWGSPTEFEWALAESDPPFNGYNNDGDAYLLNVFDDVDTSEAWTFKCLDFYVEDVGWRVGGDVNATANPDDPFVGFACAKVAYTIHDHDNWFTDDLAIMIY